VWVSGKTLRFAIDPEKPITELQHPEFYDIKITGQCLGKCIFCYMDSMPNGEHYENIVKKLKLFFGYMSLNMRPFQIAIGGGEPTLHPEFLEFLRVSKEELDICPNYTTNGMWSITRGEEERKKLIDYTKKYCGGIAVSCHPHLQKYWAEAARLYYENDIKLNFHIIISDKESVDEFVKIYKDWKDKVSYFVLLPYSAQGRATKKKIDWDYLVESLPEDMSKLAFGANFYSYLQKNPEIKVALYEPEIMSKFLDMKDMSIHKSSFNL
jgi:organic radical activating enzyme